MPRNYKPILRDYEIFYAAIKALTNIRVECLEAFQSLLVTDKGDKYFEKTISLDTYNCRHLGCSSNDRL